MKAFFEAQSADGPKSPLKKIGNSNIYLRKTAEHPLWRKEGKKNANENGASDGAINEKEEETKMEKENAVAVKKEPEVGKKSGRCNGARKLEM